MSDLDAVIANLRRGLIGDAHRILSEFAASKAGQVVKGCIAAGRRERLLKVMAARERIAGQRAALHKVRDDLTLVQARLEFLESPASLPGWMLSN